MKSVWQPESRRELQERIRKLTPDRRPAWGKMSAPQMLTHVGASLKMALGELPVASKRGPFRLPLLKQLIVYVLPWPKGAPTAPELISQASGEWTAEMDGLRLLIDRFGHRNIHGPWPEHPAFGRLSGRTWGALVYRHVDHHLQQFGL